MTEDKLSRLEALAKVANEGFATTKEVAQVVATIITVMRNSLKDILSKIADVQKSVDNGDKELSDRVDVVETTIIRERKEIDAAIQNIALTPGPKGENGNDSIVPGPKGEDGDDGSPDTPIQVRDKLESLAGNQRLDASAVKGLEDLFKAEPKGIERWIGGRAGIQVYIEGVKVGLVQYLNLLAGTGITLGYVNKNGVLTLTISSSGGSGGTWYLGEQITLQGDGVTFTLAHAPTAKLEVLLDRQPQIMGVDISGTIDGTNKTFAFTSAPDPSLSNLIYANYL